MGRIAVAVCVVFGVLVNWLTGGMPLALALAALGFLAGAYVEFLTLTWPLSLVLMIMVVGGACWGRS